MRTTKFVDDHLKTLRTSKELEINSSSSDDNMICIKLCFINYLV